jgi:hypothetical protein
MTFLTRTLAILFTGLLFTVNAHAAHKPIPPGADCASCHAKDNTHSGRFEGKCDNCHNDKSWKGIRFDHTAKTRFPLTDGHKNINCTTCHRDGPFRVRSACSSCHLKDDKHNGQQGQNCEKCHSAKTWVASEHFDHDAKTTFPLAGGHKDLPCASCHKDGKFTVKLKSTCIACHQQKDVHKGDLGVNCETCHTEEKSWTDTLFDHTRDTGKELVGKHQSAPCLGCHRPGHFKEKMPELCVFCHAKNDTHKKQFGALCGICHTEQGWKDITFNHNRTTPFQLKGKHQSAKCTGCHVGRLYVTKPTRECYYCHRKDAPHKDVEQSGARRKCESCHTEEGWSLVSE